MAALLPSRSVLINNGCAGCRWPSWSCVKHWVSVDLAPLHSFLSSRLPSVISSSWSFPAHNWYASFAGCEPGCDAPTCHSWNIACSLLRRPYSFVLYVHSSKGSCLSVKQAFDQLIMTLMIRESTPWVALTSVYTLITLLKGLAFSFSLYFNHISYSHNHTWKCFDAFCRFAKIQLHFCHISLCLFRYWLLKKKKLTSSPTLCEKNDWHSKWLLQITRSTFQGSGTAQSPFLTPALCVLFWSKCVKLHFWEVGRDVKRSGSEGRQFLLCGQTDRPVWWSCCCWSAAYLLSLTWLKMWWNPPLLRPFIDSSKSVYMSNV